LSEVAGGWVMGFGAWAKLERRRKDCLRECLGLGQQGQGYTSIRDLAVGLKVLPLTN